VKSGQLPGAIVIFHDNGTEEVSCVGYADVAAKRAITLDDHFMQCSQTKGFCGVTIAKLVEEGRISLDDPVSKYIPEFKTLWITDGSTTDVRRLTKAKNTLTIRMCMNHTGGFPFELPNYTSMGGWSRRMPLKSVAITAANSPILFEPGTKVQYSNVGIDIGAAVIEVVTGMRWEDYLKKEVLDPLGMKVSGFVPPEEWLKTKIEMYDCQTNAPAVWREYNPAMAKPYGDDRVFSSAGAGLWTTARDQIKFYKMLMNLGMGENGVRILKEETVKSILATSTRPTNLGGYSLGLGASNNGWFGHGGAWGTNCQVNWKTKQLKLVVVQLCGQPRPWWRALDTAEKAFFKAAIDNRATREYTGRMK
jgi:CubicO group peptidase (beta-lactamase class C family)